MVSEEPNDTLFIQCGTGSKARGRVCQIVIKTICQGAGNRQPDRFGFFRPRGASTRRLREFSESRTIHHDPVNVYRLATI